MQKMPSILICGGGTAGWMTAIYLQHFFNREKPLIKISLLESATVPPVGVGEATVHSIRHFLQTLGLNEKEFMRASDATFKLGIRFDGWKKPDMQGRLHSYWHPFDIQNASTADMDISSAWLKHQTILATDYAHSVSISPHLAKLHKAPKLDNSADYEAPIPYAYHFDAGKLAEYLKTVACQRGVEHIQADIQKVNIKDGIICSVLSTQGEFTADMFFDCTGFASLLSNQISAENNWHSYQDVLPCNRAVVSQTQYQKGEVPYNFTRAIAMKHGWRWKIGLQNRIGNGYVYADKHITAQQAEDEFRSALGLDEMHPVRHLKMKIGRKRQFWQGNCVSVGLSSGFIEPLESTGIYLIEAAVRLWCEHANFEWSNPVLQKRYNQLFAAIYDDLKDFIVLHYALTDRDDSAFWRDAQNVLIRCPELSEKLSLWQHKVPQSSDFWDVGSQLFNEINYRFVLYGMGYFPNTKALFSVVKKEQQSLQLLQSLLQFCEQKSQQHPQQIQWF
ncbi:tryptophan halogenase family protein [Catenovulum sediminis]|uniref:tryptophan halogenase family protein n=1 Tax=Catenovulum sediminis TaxID=1740262 RepID=UPI00163D4547|nr:tryptophan halogenase family protein [Catenovulum sediminis]